MNNSSGGFVYFNVNQTPPSPEASNFLSFNETSNYTSPENNRFSPRSYSSPNKFHQGSRSFRGRHSGRNNFRYHNKSQDNSPNNTSRNFNVPYSPNFHKNSFNRKSGQQDRSFNNGGKRDISIYFDHTSVMDPWADLEKKLAQTQQEQISNPIINHTGDESIPSTSTCKPNETTTT